MIWLTQFRHLRFIETTIFMFSNQIKGQDVPISNKKISKVVDKGKIMVNTRSPERVLQQFVSGIQNKVE